MRYWAKLAYTDFQESTGIKNTGVFWASFAEWFAKEHYKIELGIYTGKTYFNFDSSIYKPGIN